MTRSLYRCRQNRVLAGVAAGVAEFLGLDPTLVRIMWFISILFGGVGIVIYIGLALIVPLEPETPDATPAADAHLAPANHRHTATGTPSTGRVGMFIGVVLILFGTLALLEIVLPGLVSWRLLWPVVIIGAGAVLVFLAIRRREATSL